MKLLSILVHAERCVQLSLSNVWCLPLPWSSQIDLSMTVSWSREGITTPLFSYRLVLFITPADRLDLCTGVKKKSNKTSPTHWVISHTLSDLQQEWKTLASHSYAVLRAFLAKTLSDLIYQDYPPSLVSQTHFLKGAQQWETAVCVHIRGKKICRLSKQAFKEWASIWFSHLASNLFCFSLLFLSSRY